MFSYSRPADYTYLLTIFLILIFLVIGQTRVFGQTWTGAMSTAWETPANWSTNSVPTTSSDVIIPSTPTAMRFPILSTGTYGVRSLIINSGALVNQTGGKLSVAQSITNNGNYTSTGGIIEFIGTTVTILGSNSASFPGINISSDVNVIMQNNNSCTKLEFLTPKGGGSSSFTHNNNGVLTVNGDVIIRQINSNNVNKIWDINSGAAIVHGNVDIGDRNDGNGDNRVAKIIVTTGTLTINGNLNFKTKADTPGNAILDLSSGSATVNLTGLITLLTSGTILPGNSTFNYNGSTPQTINFFSALRYKHIHVNNAAGLTPNMAITSTLVSGDIRVQSGTFKNGGFANAGATTGTFEVANGATFELTGTSGMVTGFNTKIFNPSSTVAYSGTNQQISSELYGHLNLSGGSAVTKSLSSDGLTVKGNFTNNAFNSGSGKILLTGGMAAHQISATQPLNNLELNDAQGAVTTTDVTINSLLTLTSGVLQNNNVLTVKGNLVNNALHSGSGKVLLSGGTAAHQITATQPLNNLELNDALGAETTTDVTINGLLTLTSGAFTATKNLKLNSGASLFINNGSLILKSTYDLTDGSFSAGNGTVKFASQVSSTIPVMAYHNLVLEGVAGTVLTIPSNLTVNKDLQLSNTGFTLVNNNILTVKGDLINNALHSGSGKVLLSGGTTAHQISATQPVNDLELDDAMGAVHTSDVTITNVLTLRSGKLAAGTGKKLILNGSLGVVSGKAEDAGRLYEGNLEKKIMINGIGTHNFGNSGLTFDNMGGGNWGEITVTRITGPGSAITNPSNPGLQGINRNWDINPALKANSSVNLTLDWVMAEDNGLDFTNTKAQVYKSTDNGATWFPVASPIMATINGNSRSITVETSSFSRWTVSGENTPLPVELTYFTAAVTKQETVALKWATASEINNKYFDIERSSDGKNFTQIGRVKGHGTTSVLISYSFTDTSPLTGHYYYRLRQVDLDGTQEYSLIRGVNLKLNKTIDLYLSPNPVKGSQVNVLVKGLILGSETRLQVVDSAGKLVISVPLTMGQLVLPVKILSPGIYQVRVIGQNGSQTRKIVIL